MMGLSNSNFWDLTQIKSNNFQLRVGSTSHIYHTPNSYSMVTDRIMEMEKRFGMGQQTTAARRGRIFP